jgi:zeaxanthin glucosyltransferase
MARIAWLVDYEVGHILPTFRLAKDLVARGHELRYIGLPDAEPEVRREGFRCVPILESLFPAGFRGAVGTPAAQRPLSEEPRRRCFLELVQGSGLDHAFAAWRPDFLILGGFFLPEALAIRYRYDVPVAVFTTHFASQSRVEACRNILTDLTHLDQVPVHALAQVLGRRGVHASSAGAIARLMLTVPELILCPAVFELPTAPRLPLTYDVGTGVDTERVDPPFDWRGIDRTRKPLIVCAMGSRVVERDATIRFFRVLIEAARSRPDWQVIIATGRDVSPASFGTVPAHVHLRTWLPQLQVLRDANVMINHAGTGTVKECLLLGVPMVAFALGRDQFQAVDRIRHHGVGVCGDLDLVTPEAMTALVTEALHSPSIKQRVASMQEQFARSDADSAGVRAVESLLAAVAQAVRS